MCSGTKSCFGPSDGAGGTEDVPYDIDGYLIAIDTEKIDVDYMNSRFEKYLKAAASGGNEQR